MTSAEASLREPDFAAARQAMIDSQLRTSGVNTPWVLARMNAVHREDHVPASARAAAYIDRTVQLDDGGALAPALFYGMALTEARPGHTDTVLVVDGGSGYLPALLRPMVAELTVISPADAASGKASGHYSLIVIDGAVEQVPQSLGKVLADGGRIVTGLASGAMTKLATGTSTGTDIAMLPLAETSIPRLSAFDAPRKWSF